MEEFYLARTWFARRTPFVHDRKSTAYRWRLLALVAVLAAEIMDLIDGTIVGIAAPSIRAEPGGGDQMLQWVAAG
jgi:hypothetical protein